MSNTPYHALLCALNAKYVHTNLAVRYIEAYAEKFGEGFSVSLYESTVNRAVSEVADEIVKIAPDAVAFSAYIWNIRYILQVAQRVKEQIPEVKVILGGPEVSFAADEYLGSPWVDFVISGEGEKPFTELMTALANGKEPSVGYGICYKLEGTIQKDEPYFERELSALESPYTDEYIQSVSGRIAYFEASRGCPFSCAFCLSGACRGVRLFPIDFVKQSLLRLWNSGTKTVKFVDRTFNADARRADEILSFLLEHAPHMPKGVCFHFEIAADILKESTLTLLERAPKGLFQIEAGLQSFNHETLAAVTRVTDLEKLVQNMRRLCKNGNIHTHVDLIAGLPYEDLASFGDSFDKAYAIGADMLQLGFLKLLYGSALRGTADTDGMIRYAVDPPYEVTSTAWLTKEDLDALRGAADACDKLHGSGRFEQTLAYVLDATGLRPFALFLSFGGHASMPLDEFTAIVLEKFGALCGVDRDILRDKLCRDRLSTNASAKMPECLKVPDARLAKAVYLLGQMKGHALKKGVKRAVCLLYGEKSVIYADYPENAPKDGKYTVHTLKEQDFKHILKEQETP